MTSKYIQRGSRKACPQNYGNEREGRNDSIKTVNKPENRKKPEVNGEDEDLVILIYWK